jgi:hypothetical protein
MFRNADIHVEIMNEISPRLTDGMAVSVMISGQDWHEPVIAIYDLLVNAGGKNRTAAYWSDNMTGGSRLPVKAIRRALLSERVGMLPDFA